LRKTENILLQKFPIPYADYHWSIGKLGKDFYDTKFGDKTFSANKMKELITDSEKSNFNVMLVYSNDITKIGYAICRETNELLHYCYPFYELRTKNSELPSNLGLGMMLKAILWAKDNGKKYIYLGSAQRPNDTYKLQFAGFQWFNGEKWETNLEKLKDILKT